MTCPKCQHASEVIDSRLNTGNHIRRRRRCMSKKCKHKWTTYEIAADEIAEWQQAWIKLQRIEKAIEA